MEVVWSKLPKGYDAFYSSEHCKREDEALRSILANHVGPKDRVLDFGSGTENVRKLLPNETNYLGIEKDSGFKQEHSLYADARQLIKHIEPFDVATLVFSAEELGLLTLERILSKARKTIVVCYDRPYLHGSSSFFAGHAFVFKQEYEKKSKAIHNLLSKKAIDEGNLLDEPYYSYFVIKGGQNGITKRRKR